MTILRVTVHGTAVFFAVIVVVMCLNAPAAQAQVQAVEVALETTDGATGPLDVDIVTEGNAPVTLTPAQELALEAEAAVHD